MATTIRSISEDSEYYAKSFKIIKPQLTRIQADLDKIFEKTIPKKVIVRERGLKVLGIGSGSGELELKHTLQLLRTFPQISLTSIEPVPDHLDEYKQLVAKEADTLKSVTYDWRQQTLDQYRHEVGASKKYDVIVSINSVYYFDDVEDSMIYLRDILEDDGILIIVLVSENGMTYRLWDRFPHLYDASHFHRICSLHLLDVLQKCNIKYDSERIRSDVDLTECFIEGSEDGQYLLDFVSHVIDLRGSTSPECYSEFVSFLKESTRKDSTEENGVRWVFVTEQEVLYIHK
ncbi:histamine N-methyltransferase B-like [Antedon mediterranea]|uniref:histamine N-methyltransferase B-like n=1 Tax=Antedon mediterranea TaxID=105859 RepID=UPI003AF83FE1